MELPGALFSSSSKNKKNLPKKISYTLGKCKFLTLILKKPLIFSQKKAVLTFQETETPKKFLTFWETKTLKKFLIFHMKELSFISGNGNPKKLIFQAVTF